MPSQSQVKELFPLFLKKNPSAMQLLNKITARETAMFQKENHEAGLKFIRSLKNESKLPKVYEYSTNNSKFVAVNVAHPMYPGGFPTNTGEYVMVLMNYYSIPMWYPGPWWAPWEGHWGSYNYGEQDTINILYVGSYAQTWYNQETSKISNIIDMTVAASVVLATLTWIAGKLQISALTGGVANDIIYILGLTAISIGAIQYYMNGQLNAMYDTTYSNPLNNEPQFLWTYYSIADIYAGIGSSFTWNGYTNTGTVSILPYIPVASNNPAFAFVAVALSTETHQIAGKIGWNSWATES